MLLRSRFDSNSTFILIQLTNFIRFYNKLAAHMMVQRPYQIINVQNELCVTDGSNTWRSEGIGSKDKRLPNPIK